MGAGAGVARFENTNPHGGSGGIYGGIEVRSCAVGGGGRRY